MSDVNNTHKKNAQIEKDQAKIGIGNTIEYDVKSYQVKITILKCTKVCIKVLKFNRSQK